MFKLTSVVVFLLLFSMSMQAIELKDYLKRPKLTLVIVVDQFRSDYLTRFANEFLPASHSGQLGGYKFLMEKGAYFPFADYYGVLNNMTCPGHAMILSGAYASKSGIVLNEWYDQQKNKVKYCAEDEQHGVSPKNLKVSTVGDELKLIYPESKVISLALKDRAAIMMGGHAADVAFWFDTEKVGWSTSSYYQKKNDQSWLTKLNSEIKIDKESAKKVFSHKDGVTLTIDAAIFALKHFKLGQSKRSDLLALSISTHDILGHKFGPEAPEMKDITLFEDNELSRLFNAIQKSLGGLQDVQIVLTADHGIQPNMQLAQQQGIESGMLDVKAWARVVEEELHKKFKLKLNDEKIIGLTQSLHIFLNEELVARLKLNLAEVEAFIKDQIQKKGGVYQVITKSELIKGKAFLGGKLKHQFENSFHPLLSGNVIIIPQSFYREISNDIVNHMTGYNYDSRVPLIFVGPMVRPGVYTEAKVVDLATTLSFILGIIPPSSAEGRVLNEILK